MRQIESPGAEVLLSAVVVWEVAIKRSLGKLEIPDGFARALLTAGADELPFRAMHAERTEGLPRHHRDPFDRALIGQALVEGATIVTGDAAFGQYEVPLVW